jgi:hypothetical protein
MAWNDIDGNDVISGIRTLDDYGGCTKPVFERPIADGNRRTILERLGYLETIVRRIKPLDSPSTLWW